MAIPSRQIGWSTKANLLWQISKQLEQLIKVSAPNKIRDLIALFKLRVGFNNGIFEAETCLDATLVNLDSLGLLDKASLVITPNAYDTGVLYDIIPNTTLGDMTVVRATTATRVNSEGLIESVGVNIPRIDYTNGSCPSLLVEPQRTNLLTYSNDFTNGWSGTGITATANYGVTPDGTNTSTRLVFSDTNQIWRKTIIGLTGNQGVFSLYIKGVIGQTILITYGGIDNLITLSNNWERYKIIEVANSDSVFINTYGGATARDIEVWGGQIELGSYATSYIPTVASTSTRNADVISKTGISSLIGQTEGTMFWDGYYNNVTDTNARKLISVNDNSSANLIDMYIGANSNIITARVRANSSTIGVINYTINSSRIKIAYAYKNYDFVLYVNGVQIGAVLTGTISFLNPLNILQIGDGESENDEYGGFINSSQLYKTRLTNTELASLTTL